VDKIKLEILGLSSSQSDVGHFALVLAETDGNRRLPIIIDGYQARAIALELEKIKPNRPMTHDLFVSIARTFGIELKEVVITELREGIFYARLTFEFEGEQYEIDSRTSDAVAIGVRFDVPIYTTEAVLAVAGIEVKDSESEDADDFFPGDDEAESLESAEDAIEETEQDRLETLRTEMNNAINDEDYERAARLRDEIARLEGTAN
jgi:uncharacterized protein